MLFGNTKIIIYLGRSRVVVGDCRSLPAQYFEIKYENNLAQVFDKIIERLPTNSYKIILSRDISYTVKLETLIQISDRISVKEELSKHIPENFENDQFDWKLDKEGKIEAIVITSKTYHILQKIKTKYPSIRLETQSSTSLLWELGKDENTDEVSSEIFVYASNKGKEKGEDDMVLNVEVAGENVTPSEDLETPTQSKPRLNWILLVGFTFLAILILWLAWFFFLKQPQKPTTLPLQTTSPAATLTPALAEKPPSEYKLLIQNGTTTPGLAGTYKTKLAELGFTQVETGNANEPSNSTKIFINAALPDSIQNTILQVLTPLVPEITISSVDTSTSSSDIVIILGTK